MADKNKNRKHKISTEKLSLGLQSLHLNPSNSGSSGTTQTAFNLAINNQNVNVVLSINTESSKQQHSSQRQSKPITAGPKSSPQTSKPHSNPNTTQKNHPHGSKTHPNLSSGQKNSPSTSNTHTNTNSAQKKSSNTSKTHPNLSSGQKNSPSTSKTHTNTNNAQKKSSNTSKTHPNSNTGQNSSQNHSNSNTVQKKPHHPPKANPSISTGQNKPSPLPPIQKKSFKNTFNPHPKFNTGSKSYPHAFRTPSNWSTGPRGFYPDLTSHTNCSVGYEISSAAFNIQPNLNNFALSNSPVQFHGSRDHSPRPHHTDHHSDRYQLKENVTEEPEQRPRPDTNENGLNCPTCKAPYLPQIYQCASGHSACRSCKEKGWSCGICGQDITDMRNFTLEGYLVEKKVPCPHEGCKLFMKMLEVDVHIKECPFGMLECPAGCSYKMPLKQLSGHFDDHHPGERLGGVGSEVDLRYIYEPSEKMYLIQMGPFHFLFHEWISPEDQRIYMAAQLIGTKVSASKWFYEIHIYAKNEPHRKYTFSEICTSFVEPVADVFNESKCCILTQARAVTFLNNAVVNYKVFIKKIAENKPEIELCD